MLLNLLLVGDPAIQLCPCTYSSPAARESELETPWGPKVKGDSPSREGNTREKTGVY